MTARSWIRIGIVLAILTIISGAGVRGYFMGYSASEARYAVALAKTQKAQFKAAEAASRAEALRLAAEALTASLAQELEDAARADSDASRPALGADSVRRLKNR